MKLRYLLILLFATQADAASVTYTFVNYPDEQNGATVSGHFTLRPGSGFSTMDVLDWSVTLSQGGDSFTTGMSDPSAMLTPLGQIKRTATELTIEPGAGWLLIESSAISLSYNRNPDQYSGTGGNTIAWQSSSLGRSSRWVFELYLHR
jgi:hypothetical protein